MALVSRETAEKVDIPHEPGEWIRFRPLSGEELEKAENANTDDVVKRFMDVIPQLREISRDEVRTVTDPVERAMNTYDATTMLNAAITEWSYGDDVIPANVSRLDPVTREWAHRHVCEQNVIPPQNGSS